MYNIIITKYYKGFRLFLRIIAIALVLRYIGFIIKLFLGYYNAYLILLPYLLIYYILISFYFIPYVISILTRLYS